MNISDSNDGICYQNENVLVFFGKKGCDLKRLQILFPQIQFRGVKQTHSDQIIESFQGSGEIEADAHWTSEKNIGLLIKTADCIPAMAYEKSTGKIAAIHAGWRGVANLITALTLKPFSKFDLFIGPHIQARSFEVKSDTQALFNQSVPDLDPKNFTHSDNGQIKINLEKIVLHQLGQNRIENFYSTNVDTKTHPEFHSHRRDHQNSGRNLSFICLLT